jgi:hypothetical protein
MNDVIWSERDWSRGVVRKLVRGTPNVSTPQSPNYGYTPINARSLLARRGLATHREEPSESVAAVPQVSTVVQNPIVHSAPVTRVIEKPRVVEERFLPLSTETIETLEALLVWTLACATASSAFLLDAQGFIVERVGEWAFELAEATGAQVLLAMERLGKTELTETTLRSLNVEFEDHWLTAIPLPAGHGETYTLCLVTFATLPSALVRHVHKCVSEAILLV